MGNNSSQGHNQQDFNINDWDQILYEAGSRVLANRRNSHLQIQQHSIIISNHRDLQLAQQLFFLRKNHPMLVNVYNYQVFDNNRSPHHQTFTGLLYTERIPARLSHISPVSFPDCLHLIAQTVYGLERLCQYFNYFQVNPSCMGINFQNTVKVWHNPNFASMYPYQSAFSQQQMVHSILQTLQPYIDEYTMPRQEPSFKKFIQKQTNHLNFDILKSKIIQFSRIFNHSYIPSKLQYIQPAKKPTTVRNFNPPMTQSLKYTPLINQTNLNNSRTQNQQYMQTSVPTLQNIHTSQVYNYPVNYVNVNKVNYVQPIPNIHIIPSYQHQQIQNQRTMITSNLRQNIHVNSNANLTTQFVVNNNPLMKPNIHMSSQRNFQMVPPTQIQQNYIKQPQVFYHPQDNQYKFNLNLEQVKNRSGISSANRYFVNNVRQGPYTERRPVNRSIDAIHQSSYRQNNQQNIKPLTVNPMPRSASAQNYLFSQQKKPKSFRQRSNSQIKNAIQDKTRIQNTKTSLPFQQMNFSQKLHDQPLYQETRYESIQNQYKPLIIKQSIFGVEHKKKNSTNFYQPDLQNNFNKMSNYPQPQRINRQLGLQSSPTYQSNINKSENENKSLKVSVLIPQSKYYEQFDSNFKKNQLKSFSPHKQHQSHKISLIKLSKVKMSQENKQQIQQQQRDTINLLQDNTKKSSVPAFLSKAQSPSSYSSIGGPGTFQQNRSFFNDNNYSQFVNNNSYLNNQSDSYSQVAQLNSPLDFRLKNNKKTAPQVINDKHLTNSKIFSQQNTKGGEASSLDLMSKLKITTTINKEEETNEKPQKKDQQKQKKKLRKIPLKSKLFNKEVAKLGFMYSQQSSSEIQSPNQKGDRQQALKTNVKEWTPSYGDYSPMQPKIEKQKRKSYTYEQLMQSYNYEKYLNYARSNTYQPNYKNQKPFAQATYNHIQRDQQPQHYQTPNNYKKYQGHSYVNQQVTHNKKYAYEYPSPNLSNDFKSNKQDQYHYPSRQSQYTMPSQKISENKLQDYEFDWDPEILADLQSNAYKQSFQK